MCVIFDFVVSRIVSMNLGYVESRVIPVILGEPWLVRFFEQQGGFGVVVRVSCYLAPASLDLIFACFWMKLRLLEALTR
jgi:hypothetical protein